MKPLEKIFFYDVMFFDKIRNNLHARVAAAALPGASAETKATGVGATVMLASRFKTHVPELIRPPLTLT
jgi:hypothetical protein